jgi:hypothetical protein
MIVVRSQDIKEFADKIVQHAKRQAQLYKEHFGKYMTGYEQLYKLTTNSMGLTKIIEKIEAQQEPGKLNYFSRHILSPRAKEILTTIVSVDAKDDYHLAITFLQLSA